MYSCVRVFVCSCVRVFMCLCIYLFILFINIFIKQRSPHPIPIEIPVLIHIFLCLSVYLSFGQKKKTSREEITFYTVQPSHYETEIGDLDFCSIFDITWRVGNRSSWRQGIISC